MSFRKGSTCTPSEKTCGSNFFDLKLKDVFIYRFYLLMHDEITRWLYEFDDSLYEISISYLLKPSFAFRINFYADANYFFSVFINLFFQRFIYFCSNLCKMCKTNNNFNYRTKDIEYGFVQVSNIISFQFVHVV